MVWFFSIWHFQQWLNFSLQVAIDSLWLRASHIQEVDYYYIYTFPFPNNNKSDFFFCQITTAPINPFRFHEKKLNFFVSLFFAYLINCGKSSILFFLSLHKKNDRLPPTWKTTNTTLLIVCSVFNHLDFSEKPVY